MSTYPGFSLSCPAQELVLPVASSMPQVPVLIGSACEQKLLHHHSKYSREPEKIPAVIASEEKTYVIRTASKEKARVSTVALFNDSAFLVLH